MASFVADDTVTVTKKVISEKLVFFTESTKGPPASFTYYCETVGFYKVKLTLNFEGSTNFELTGENIDPKKKLQVVLIVAPNSKESKKAVLRQIDPKKGGSMKMAMSYTMEKPDEAQCREFLNIFESKIKEEIEIGKRTFPPDTVRRYTLEQIQQHCETIQQKLFIDVQFPPLSSSLFNGHEQVSFHKSTIEIFSYHPAVWFDNACRLMMIPPWSNALIHCC